MVYSKSRKGLYSCKIFTKMDFDETMYWCDKYILNLVLVKSCAIHEIYSTLCFIADIASFLIQAVKETHD